MGKASRLVWLILFLALFVGFTSTGVAKAEPCILRAPPLTGQATRSDIYLFVEFTSPEYVLVSFGPFAVSSDDELIPLEQTFIDRVRAAGKVNVRAMMPAKRLPEGPYLPTYTPEQFSQFDGSGGLSLPNMTSDLGAITSGQPPQITKPTEGQTFEVELGREWSFRIEARDPESDPLYYELVAFNYPRDMYIWDLNGLIRWKPISSDLLGKHQVVIGVSDTPWPYTCQVRRAFYVNVVDTPVEPPVSPPAPVSPPTPPAPQPPAPAPQAPPNTPTGGTNGTQPSPPAETGQGGPAPQEPSPGQTGGNPGQNTNPQPQPQPKPNPVESSGGDPPSTNTVNTVPDTVPDAATLQEIQRQLDEIQKLADELEDEVNRILAEPSQPATGSGSGAIPLGFRFEKKLEYGMRDQEVKYLQIVLNSDPDTRLADSGPGSPGHETVNFGDRTYNAVIKFQEKYAREILHPLDLWQGTGLVGARTRTKLNEILDARLGGSTLKPAPGEQTFTDELNRTVIDGLNTAIDGLNMALEEFNNQLRNSPLGSPFVQIFAPVPKFGLAGSILAKGSNLKVGKKVVSSVDKLKGKVTEAETFIRKTLKLSRKLTSTQQIAYEAVINNPDKMHKIFNDPGHKLQPLVDRLGSKEKVVEEVARSLEKVDTDSRGVFKVTRNIAGFDMTIQGRIINGIIRISDF